MLILFAAVFVLSTAQRLSNDATEELARLSSEITSKHFSKSKCVAVVTDYNADIMQYMNPINIPFVSVHLPFNTMSNCKVHSTGWQ
jgi:hypothetical protein